MPLSLTPEIVEGRVYRGRRKKDGDDEAQALKELQYMLSIKNRKPCNCEAQIHELIENCQKCGRLACLSEGPGKCLFCGNLILTKDQRSRLQNHIAILPNNLFGSMQREKKDSKTRIIDHQYDQFSISSKQHLTQSAKSHMLEDLDDLQRQRYQRKLVFDMFLEGSSSSDHIESVLKIDDYAAELERLQLDDGPVERQSELSLPELVALESKRNYEFVYVKTITQRKAGAKNVNSTGKKGPREKKNQPPKGSQKKTKSNRK